MTRNRSMDDLKQKNERVSPKLFHLFYLENARQKLLQKTDKTKKHYLSSE